MNDQPCFNCADRRKGCHDNCERYAAFTKKQAEIRVARQTSEKIDRDYLSARKRRKRSTS